MKIVVKRLRGSEITVEVQPETQIRDLKTLVSAALFIHEEDQKLLLSGKTLSDEHTIAYYPTIQEGTLINLVVQKPENLPEAARNLFRKYYKEPDVTNVTAKFMDIVQKKFDALSLDDIERLAISCMNSDHIKHD